MFLPRSSHQPVSLVTNITQAGTLADGRRMWSTTNRPDPRFGNIYVACSIGDSKYNGLVVTVTKRFGSGYSLQGSYHLSKSTSAGYLDDNLAFGLFDSPSDPQNLEVDRGRNDNDMRHRVWAADVRGGAKAVPAGHAVHLLIGRATKRLHRASRPCVRKGGQCGHC